MSAISVLDGSMVEGQVNGFFGPFLPRSKKKKVGDEEAF